MSATNNPVDFNTLQQCNNHADAALSQEEKAHAESKHAEVEMVLFAVKCQSELSCTVLLAVHYCSTVQRPHGS